MNIKKNAQKVMMVAVAALVIMSSLMFTVNTDAGGSSDKVLFDMGNGSTVWSDINGTGTIDDVLRKAASDSGFEYSSSSGKITLNGLTETTIGGAAAGGSLGSPGATGKKVTAKWTPFVWDSENGKWVKVTNINSAYPGGSLAIGFYSDGQVPTETPDHPKSWTMIRGDAHQTGAQDAVASEEKAELKWSSEIKNKGVYAAVLYAQDRIFVKHGASAPPASSTFVCYSMDGEMLWKIEFPSVMYYEITTPAIVGDNIYVPTSHGYILKIPLIEGPGENNENVTTFGNVKYNSLNTSDKVGAIPSVTAPLTGMKFNNGPGSLVYDSGVIYVGSCNGMIYCFDLDLNLIWSQQLGGCAYFFSHTVYNGYIFAGALDGKLYAIDKTNGKVIDNILVYTRTVSGREYGSVQQVAVFEEAGKYVLMFGVSDGRGLNSMIGGIGIYVFDGSKLSKRALIMDEFGLVPNYVLPIDNDEFRGVYFTGSKGLFRVDISGKTELINSDFNTQRAPMTLVNGDSIYIQSYTINEPIYVVSLDGRIKNAYTPNTAVTNFSMNPPLIIDGWLFSGNDSGLNVSYGSLPRYGGGNEGETPLIFTLAMILAVILAVLAVLYIVIRVVKKEKNPFNYISRSVKHYLGGEDLRHNRRSRNRLRVVLAIGILISVAVFITSLCVGYQATMSLGEMLSSLFSAITHGGADPSNLNEIRVFESRLPRTLAAFAVGVGLSIAGSMYQAIIRNPLVDPYIMGVSAGAGTAAVAVIAFNFTFFGLLSPGSIYATAIIAMIGGLIAFSITMFIAEKAGGASINYVLAGVVVGLAFSAVQTLMLSMAGQNVSNALTWLFGSFANVTWDQVWLILLPGLSMAMVPLLWAKEFNLVLLGEDQAQQMGLNVRRFNRSMLILASLLTSLCVAFVGIIGFVGLVIPHLCRMMLGGDHRLVLPTSIAFGGALMMLADLASRTLYLGQELPVGAITTMIGVPVFAYLLIRRGKMYEG